MIRALTSFLSIYPRNISALAITIFLALFLFIILLADFRQQYLSYHFKLQLQSICSKKLSKSIDLLFTSGIILI